MRGKQHREIQNNGSKSTQTEGRHVTLTSNNRTPADKAHVPDVHSSVKDADSILMDTQPQCLFPATARRRFAIFIEDDVQQPAIECVLNYCWHNDISVGLFSEREGRVVGSQGMVHDVQGCPPASLAPRYKTILFLSANMMVQGSDAMPCTAAFLRAAFQTGSKVYHCFPNGRRALEWHAKFLDPVFGNNKHLTEGPLSKAANGIGLELLLPIHCQ